jgi:predicted permease
MSTLVSDLRRAVRQFNQNPIASLVIIATIALGIGANTAIFSVFDSLMLRELPVIHPEQIVWITNTGAYGTQAFSSSDLFSTYRGNNVAFSDVFSFAGPERWTSIDGTDKRSIQAEVVSGNYFSALGIQPEFGRLLSPQDESENSPVVVLSYDYWKRILNGDASIVGRKLTLNQTIYTIVGVAPPEFFGTVVGSSPDAYVPLAGTGPRQQSSVVIMGRLKPGVSLIQAQDAIEPLYRQVTGARVQRIAAVSPTVAGYVGQMFTHALVLDASHGISQLRIRLSMSVQILMAVVGVVLLMGCINLSSLVLMRGMQRRKEFALRVALGASRWDLCRAVLTETALLVTTGTIAGLLIAHLVITTLMHSIAQDALPGAIRVSPVILTAGISSRVLLFTAGLLAITTILCGLLPAWLTSSTAVLTDLKEANHQLGQRRSRSSRVLVSGQVALLVFLLLGTSLLLRSLMKLEKADVGFDADQVLVLSVNDQPPSSSNGEDKTFQTRLESFYGQLAERARSLPGVVSVSFSQSPPLRGTEGAPVDVIAEGKPDPQQLRPDVFYAWVAPDYFKTLGISILTGREFSPQDISITSPAAPTVINRTLARRLFGTEEAVGKRFKVLVTGQQFDVIGVAKDSRFHDVREAAIPMFYYPIKSGKTVEVRTSRDPKYLSATMLSLAHSVDSAIKVNSVSSLRQTIGRSLYRDKLVASFCAAFSILAVVLACIGLYGTYSFDTRRRTNEIGVRMALGATRKDVIHLVLGQGLRQAGYGLIVGAILAGWSELLGRKVLFGADAFNVPNPGLTGADGFIRIEKGFLFGVKPYDAASLILVPIIVIFVALIATYLPANRAAGVDPTSSLRSE